jgi:hypothetical protein
MTRRGITSQKFCCRTGGLPTRLSLLGSRAGGRGAETPEQREREVRGSSARLSLYYATRLSLALETSSAPVFSRIVLAREIQSGLSACTEIRMPPFFNRVS